MPMATEESSPVAMTNGRLTHLPSCRRFVFSRMKRDEPLTSTVLHCNGILRHTSSLSLGTDRFRITSFFPGPFASVVSASLATHQILVQTLPHSLSCNRELRPSTCCRRRFSPLTDAKQLPFLHFLCSFRPPRTRASEPIGPRRERASQSAARAVADRKRDRLLAVPGDPYRLIGLDGICVHRGMEATRPSGGGKRPEFLEFNNLATRSLVDFRFRLPPCPGQLQ